MNHAEAPRDDAEVLRLFQERDQLGADSHLLLRVYRQLTDQGKPIGQVFLFSVPIDPETTLPIGALTLTGNNRLVFWPVLPRIACSVVNKPGMELPDHITVELAQEKVHTTSYDSMGGSRHVGQGWRSAPLRDTGLNLLFTYLVQALVIGDQDVMASRKFPVPPTDHERRAAEFTKCASKLVHVHLPIPAHMCDRQYFAFSLYLARQPIPEDTLRETLVPFFGNCGLIDGWLPDCEFPIVAAQFEIGEHRFCLSASLPPGHLKDPLNLGLPRRQ
jgi:hypothetical protein